LDGDGWIERLIGAAARERGWRCRFVFRLLHTEAENREEQRQGRHEEGYRSERHTTREGRGAVRSKMVGMSGVDEPEQCAGGGRWVELHKEAKPGSIPC
jgi:hypothetical protein